MLFPKTQLVYETDMPPQDILTAVQRYCAQRKTFRCAVPRNQGEGLGRRFSLGRYANLMKPASGVHSLIEAAVENDGGHSVVTVVVRAPVISSCILYAATALVIFGMAMMSIKEGKINYHAALPLIFLLVIYVINSYCYRSDVSSTRELFECILGKRHARDD